MARERDEADPLADMRQRLEEVLAPALDAGRAWADIAATDPGWLDRMADTMPLRLRCALDQLAEAAAPRDEALDDDTES
jgi:hypothetical protein